MANLSCFFVGHRKEYVAVKVDLLLGCFNIWYRGTEARWVCKRNGCKDMGSDRFKGYLTISHGKLVVDEKAWANWENGD